MRCAIDPDWILRSATPSDLGALLSLERSVVGAPHWSEAAWQDLLASSSPLVRPATASFYRLVLVAERGDVPAAFLVLVVAADIAELESVAVEPARRRAGLARELCAQALAWARERGALQVELEVRPSNSSALALYRSLGFEEEARRPAYYRDPLEDALLLRRPL